MKKKALKYGGLGLLGLIVVVAILQGLGIIKPKEKENISTTGQTTAVQQTTTTQSTTIPETTTAEEAVFNVNWETCIAETKEELTDTEFFSYVKEIGIFINEEEKEITFSASLDDATDPAVALDFADTLIRRFNLSARAQDSTIKSGEKDYYGGIYDTYSIIIGIAPYSKTDDYKEWFIYDAVAVGAHTKIKLQSK